MSKQEEFRQKVHELTRGTYEVLGDYRNNKIKVLFKHHKNSEGKACGHEFSMTPNHFLDNGQRCPKCSHRGSQKSSEEFRQELNEIYRGEYTLVSEYNKALKPIIIRHEPCGQKFKSYANNIKKTPTACPKCYPHPSKVMVE